MSALLKTLFRILLWIIGYPFFFVGLGTMLVGFGTVVLQVYKWLKTALWISIPFSKAFEYLHFDLGFVQVPKDWHGLAMTVQFILEGPLSVCLILGGLILLLFGGFVLDTAHQLGTSEPDSDSKVIANHKYPLDTLNKY